MSRDICCAWYVLHEHVAVVNECHAVHIDTQISPVSRHDVTAFLRKSDRFPYLAHRVCSCSEQIRVFFLENTWISFAVGCAYIGSSGHSFIKQLKIFFHLPAGTRDVVFHLVDEILTAERHAYIHRSTVCIFTDYAEAVRYFFPVHFHSVIHHHLTDLCRIIRASDIAEFMQRRFEFKPSSSEACCAPARQIMLLYQKHLFALNGTVKCRGQTRVSGADNNYVIMFFQSTHPLFSSQVLFIFHLRCGLLICVIITLLLSEKKCDCSRRSAFC